MAGLIGLHTAYCRTRGHWQPIGTLKLYDGLTKGAPSTCLTTVDAGVTEGSSVVIFFSLWTSLYAANILNKFMTKLKCCRYEKLHPWILHRFFSATWGLGFKNPIHLCCTINCATCEFTRNDNLFTNLLITTGLAAKRANQRLLWLGKAASNHTL